MICDHLSNLLYAKLCLQVYKKQLVRSLLDPYLFLIQSITKLWKHGLEKGKELSEQLE
ncbi:hypothetical protein EFW57_01347 [Bacillus velezensis]|nr:hypothetical protein EFW57_01347 [Bacillus velezensis]